MKNSDFYPNIYEDRGFLTCPDPIEKLPSSGIFNTIDNLAYSLSEHVRMGTVRKELDRLQPYGFSNSVLSSYRERAVLNRLRMIYAYFASAYVHGAPDFNGHLPVQIAKPLCILSEIVKRPPILSYADYALSNWKKIDPSKDIELGNIRLLQHFHGIKDESWFILVHVDIEAKAGRLLKSLYNLIEFIWTGQEYNDDLFSGGLEIILSSFVEINNVLRRMPEQCSPEVYYKQVRPYIFGFENVIYDGVPNCSFFGSTVGQNFRGETGAQSSIVPAVLAGLGIKHKDSILTSHLNDMRKYMPVSHRNFIAHLEQSLPIRNYILKTNPGKHVNVLFNKIVEQLCTFREIHFQYAVDYIQKKCDNPDGTGGTNYISWLGELVKETKSYYLKIS